MLYQSAAPDSLKLSAFTDKDEVFVNSILYGTCPVNTDVIRSLRKIVEKTTLAADSAVGVKGITCVLDCLLHICEEDDCCNWEELHLEFVKLLRLCLNFTASVSDNSGTFKSLPLKIINLISISSDKHVLVKNSVVKVLSQPVIDFVLNTSISVIVRRNILKSFNQVLSQSNRCLREELVEAVRGQLSSLPEVLLTCGDYDFQTAIMELIFRFISIKANRQSLCSWFNGYPEIQNAFVNTSFKDFDPECRTFLNRVNSSLGSNQLVCTFPCARAFLGETEVFKPKDEHYKEFWVDFNMGSKCVSILCDSSSLTGGTEGNLWEVVNIPCTFIKRAILDRGRLGVVMPKVAQSLILEVGGLQGKDVQECLVSVKEIKIIFEQSSGLISLTEKVLPTLFGEVFQNMNAAKQRQVPSDLKATGQKHHSLFKRAAKISASRVAVVSISNTTLDHSSKYKPLQVTKSPRNCQNRHSQGMIAVRTDVVVCQRAENVVSTEPTRDGDFTVQESPDVQDLKEILTAHRIESYNLSARSHIVSPELSRISEEMLSQVSTVIRASGKCEASIITGSHTSPSISDVKEKYLSTKSGSLNQQNEQCGLVKKGKEMAVRYWETAPVVSCCSKRGEESCESLDKRMKQTAAPNASMTPSIHLSKIERIENKIVKHKFSSSHRVKSSQTVHIKAGAESSENNLVINSDSRKSKVVSSIKTPLERPNKLLCREDGTDHNSDRNIGVAEDVLFGKPKQSLHKPKELTEVPSSNILQGIENFQKNKDSNLRSVPESSSSSQEVVLSHGTREFSDKPPDQIELLDLQIKEQSCSNVVEVRQGVASCVTFRRKSNGTKLEEIKVSVSKNNLSLVTNSQEGKLVSCMDGNTTGKSKTPLHMCQENDDSSAAKSAARNISDTEETQQTANFNATIKGESRKLHNKHIKHSVTERVSVNTSHDRIAKRNVTTNEMKLVHKHGEETGIPTLKQNAQNYADFVEDKQAKSSRRINSTPKRLHNQQQAALSVSEHRTLNNLDSPAKSDSHVRSNVALSLRRTCKKPQEQVTSLNSNNNTQNDVGSFEDNTVASCKNVSEALTILHDKQQEEMRNSAENNFDMLMKSTAVKSRLIKQSEEQIFSMKNCAENDFDFVEGRKMVNSRNTVEREMRLNSKQQENIGDNAVNSDSLPKPAVEKFELCKKRQKESEVLQETAKNVPDVTEHKKTLRSRKIIEKSPELPRKQQRKLQSCSVIDPESLAEPTVDKSRRLHKKPEEQIEPLKNNAQNMPHIAEHSKIENPKETAKISKRQRSKKQVQVIKEPDAQIETSKSNAQNESDFVEDKKMDSKERVKRSQRHLDRSKKPKEKIKTLQNNAQNESHYVADKEIADAREKMEISNKEQVEVSKKLEEQFGSLKESAQNKLVFVHDGKMANSKQTMKISKGLHSKQDVEVMNLTVNSSDSVAKPTADRSVTLCKKPVEQIELSDYESNLHGQSIILSQRPKELIYESEEKTECLVSRMLEPLQNEQHAFTSKAVVDKSEKLCHMSSDNVKNHVLVNHYANKQVAYTEDGLNGRLKGTKYRTVSGGNSSELLQSQQMNVPGSEATCSLRQVLHKAQMDKFPGLNDEEQTAASEAASGIRVMTTGGRSHEVENSVGKIYSNNHTSSDCCVIEPRRIDGKETDVLQASRNNHLSSHSAQKRDTSKDAKVASSSNTSLCGSNIQKLGAATSDFSCLGSSNFAVSKTHGAVSRVSSKLEAEDSTEKCIQRSVNRKPRCFVDLQQIIHEWDSDTEGDRNYEFLQGDNTSYEGVLPQQEQVIKSPTVKMQQYAKEKDISAVLENQEDSLCDKASATNEKNAALTMNVNSHKHLESPLASHAISVELQNVHVNIHTSENEAHEVNTNLESKNTVNSSNVHKVDTAKSVKSCQLKSPCSSRDRDNVQETEGLRVTNNVPSSEALVRLSRTPERSNDHFKTPFHRRRLFSSADTPEVIEFKDCDDTSGTSSTRFLTHSSIRTKKIILTGRKSNVNKTPMKKIQDDNRERKKTKSVSACREQDQSGTTGSFGGLSQTAGLDVLTPCHFSIKRFSGRWRNKYLEEVKKRKPGKKCNENVQHPVYISVYSDIETDNDSVLSWMEPEKPERSEVAQKHKLTYEKRKRTKFLSKEKKKKNKKKKKKKEEVVVPYDTEIDSDGALNQLERRKQVSEVTEKHKVSIEKESRIIDSGSQKEEKGMCPKQRNSQAAFSTTKEHINKLESRRNDPGKSNSEKCSSPGKKTSRDCSVETFVTHAVELHVSHLEVLRSNGNEQVEEAVPVEINVLPCCNGAAAPDSRILPSLIVEAKRTAGSKIPYVNEKEVLNDKTVKESSSEKRLGQSSDSFLPEKGEHPFGINIGSAYPERCPKPQGQMNDSSCLQKDGQFVSPTTGTQCLERGHISEDQINDLLLLKRRGKTVSPVIGVPCSKRARVSLSPCAREFLPASPVFGPSVPTEAEAANSTVSVLLQCKSTSQSTRTGSTFREVIPEGGVSSQQKNMLLNLEYAAKDSAMQIGKGDCKSNKKNGYSNKENVGETTVTKERRKCKKNTSMNLRAEGSYTHGDGRTMTMEEITEADDEGLVLEADDGGALKLTGNSVADCESARTVKVMNPCTPQVRDFMSGFIQSSSQMVEENITQTNRNITKKRNGLIADYIQNCESEMDAIKSKIEHLKHQEIHWQKLENNVKHLRQMHQNYMNEISESMSRLSNCHSCFCKKWQKLEEKQ